MTDNQELLKHLTEQEEKLNKIYKSVEQTRKMILWSGIATLVTFVIPFILLIFMLPKAIDIFSGGAKLDRASSSLQGGENLQIESLSDTLNNLKNLGF